MLVMLYSPELMGGGGRPDFVRGLGRACGSDPNKNRGGAASYPIRQLSAV